MNNIDSSEFTESEWHERVADIPIPIEVLLGRAHVPVARMLKFPPGEVIKLDKSFGESLEIRVGDRLIGYGEIVTTDDGNTIGIKLLSVIDGIRFRSRHAERE
ncbi:hypothetical protein GR158_03095 [Shinella sp. AETb1-6]|uniref:FliM/FliN family flagellar motor switch protein n=1 Tax=Shinella sp. AETb1-6 TaxID=2692210 RepID=UPI00137038FB|nr:FliM/FliN family flagellar motor switch protein [Shinella sp. AETb1-6]MXN50092.1 hypothetical protein [Shinella sp. AETb1-6]